MIEWLSNNKEMIGLFAIILLTGVKYAADYSDKLDKVFGKMRATKSKRRQEDMKKAFCSGEFKRAVKEVVDPQTMQLMKLEIREIYEKYKDKKEIPERAFMDYQEIFELYVSSGGNSYTKEVIDPEIRSWTIV